VSHDEDERYDESRWQDEAEWHDEPEASVGRDGWPAVAEADLGEVPGSSSIRRYTKEAAKQRAGAKIGTLLSDVYYAGIILAIGVSVAAGVAGSLRSSLPEVSYADGVGVSLPALVGVLVGALVATLVSLAGRLGPVGAGGAEAAWWLGLPVDRRGLLRPAARRLPLVALAIGGVVVALLDGGLLGDQGDRVVRAGIAGALLAALVVLGMAAAQTLGSTRRAGALTGDLLLVAVPVAMGVLAWVGVTPEHLPVPSWPVLGAIAALAVALAWFTDSRLGRIRGASLRESGSVAAQAVGAMVSMDSRELGRALSDGAAPAARRWVSRLRTVRGPVSALVTADLVLLRRSVRHLVQVVLAIAIPVLATVVPQLSGQVPVLMAVLIGGYVAASASAEGSRRAEMAPILDRLLPLDPKTARRARMMVPGMVMTVWSLVVFAAIGRWLGDPLGWLALALPGVLAWAAAAVRAAYRPAPDWSSTLVSTPFGALPTGVGAVLARGPDIVVLGLLPTWIALVLGHVTQVLVMAQVLTALIAVMVASSTSTKTFTERMLDAQKEADEQRKAAQAQAGRR